MVIWGWFMTLGLPSLFFGTPFDLKNDLITLEVRLVPWWESSQLQPFVGPMIIALSVAFYRVTHVNHFIATFITFILPYDS